jgi:hypothetical protein
MPVKDQQSYKFSQMPPDSLIQQLFREASDNLAAFDNDGDIVVEKDIHCRSLYVDEESIYIGGVKFQSPKFAEDGNIIQYDRATKKFTYKTTSDNGDLFGFFMG